VEGRCERHLFDQAVDLCGRCGQEFCGTCLVYSFGPKKPPFCLPCAVEASGVRQGAGFRPPLNRKAQKQLARHREAWLRERALRGVPTAADAAMSSGGALDAAGGFWSENPAY